MKKKKNDKIIALGDAVNLTTEVFGDVDKAIEWMHAPNPYFFNKSPFDVCLTNDSESVIEFLKEKLGK
jgi:uncharacterized protein (DUF2384 family)